jgi:hypothetical protein
MSNLHDARQFATLPPLQNFFVGQAQAQELSHVSQLLEDPIAAVQDCV